MSNERARQQARSLEQFWDALVSGQTTPSTGNLDSEVITIARHLRALSRPVSTDQTFEVNLWEDLMQTHEPQGNAQLRPKEPAPR